MLISLRSVGVGYSYADYGETVETTEDAAKNVHAFITIFFDTFTEFAGKPVHLSGESYGVRTIPSNYTLARVNVCSQRTMCTGPIPSRLRELHLRPERDRQGSRQADNQHAKCADREWDNGHIDVRMSVSCFIKKVCLDLEQSIQVICGAVRHRVRNRGIGCSFPEHQ